MTPRLERARLALRLRRTLRQRARVDRLSEAAAAAWRKERLDRLREHAVRRSPWYREHHAGLDHAPLAELPILTKRDVVERFDDLVTDRRLRLDDLRSAVAAGDGGRALGRYRVGASSGSTGRPGLFPFDEAEWVEILAASARARAIPGRPSVRGPVRTARIGSPSPGHLSRQVAATLSDPRKPSLTLSAAADVGALVPDLERFRPHLLTGYPTVLGALADLQLAGDLALAPAQVFTGGERLTPLTRARITAAWGVAPFDQYLTTEAGFVAIECPAHEGLHVLEDHVVVEVVDDDGRPVAAGDVGTRVLLSVLGSRTLPLLRYELEDVATEAVGACPCGRRTGRLRSVAGVPRRLLRLPGAGGGVVDVHPVVVTAVLDAAPVQGWQVVHDRAHVRALVVGASPDSAVELETALRSALAGAGADPSAVHLARVERISRAASGKAALVVAREGPGSEADGAEGVGRPVDGGGERGVGGLEP